MFQAPFLLTFTAMSLSLRACLVLLWLTAYGFAHANKPVYDFNATCRQAYKEIVQLRLEPAQQLLEKEKAQNPGNLIPHLLENYIDFFILFFNEDPQEFERRKNNRDKRLQLLNGGPAQSPFYRYAKAVLYFQWAAIEVKMGSRWDGGWDFRRSYLQIKANAADFPNFAPNEMFMGAMQTVAGTIPQGYQWLASILGINGSISKGMAKLENFVHGKGAWQSLFREEAIFYYCYLKFHLLNQKQEVMEFIRRQSLDVTHNHLFAYMAANLAVNSQRAAYAETILMQRSKAPGYYPLHIWDLETGVAKLYRLDPEAEIYLQRFLQQFKGRYYVKDALLRLAWFYYLRGNTSRAEAYKAQIPLRGSNDTDADKHALKEATKAGWPDTLLLRSRLLNDGGYHREALQVLLRKQPSDYQLPVQQVEYIYRLARIRDDMGDTAAAIRHYQEAYHKGRELKEYFAARAALQLGYIYENRRQCAMAITWFNRCMALSGHDFKNSLDQRAKAGIARCTGN